MPDGSHVFQRVVCGANGSKPSAAAVALAARVVAEDGTLTLVTVDDVSIAVHAGWAMSRVAEQLAQEAIAASEHAQTESSPLHEAETRLLEGNPLDVLRAEVDRMDASLVVVGSRDQSRAVGIALGSVTTHLLHEAPCSVLVARSPRELERWPRTIVAGVDGSPGSALALAAAQDLASRRGSSVRVVAATREPQLDLDAARALAPELEERDERVLDLLHTISEEADLLVVGSRGLRGIRALGSVSERVAHEALCPVLVVRGGDG
jgi:nucleotide-binding universal stress UspA family protein